MMLKTLFDLAKIDPRAAYLLDRSVLMDSGCLEWQRSKIKQPPAKGDPALPMGVTWLARLGKYRVQIGGTPRRHVGVYKTVEEASAAYQAEVEKALQKAKAEA